MKALNDFLSKLKNLPKGMQLKTPTLKVERQFLIVLASIILFALANAWLVTAVISPALEARSQLAPMVEQERAMLISARRMREESPDALEQRIASNQATVSAAGALFADEAQVTSILNAVYQNANLSGVALTELSLPDATPTPTVVLSVKTVTPTPRTVKPTATPKVSGTPGTNNPTAKPTPTVPAAVPSIPTSSVPTLYNTKTIRLRAQGTTQRLINFMARLQESNAPGVTITDLALTEDDELASLRLDLVLYISSSANSTARNQNSSSRTSFSPPTALPAQPSPTATPYIVLIPYGTTPVVSDSAVTSPPNTIVVPNGSDISMPAPSPAAQRTVKYFVEEGDTWNSLAERFHLTAQSLMDANGTSNPNLVVGQRLLIPVQ